MFYETCHILNCTNPESHLAISHKCEYCGGCGHSIRECGDSYKLAELSRIDFKSNEQCQILFCKNKNSHTTNRHICDVCKVKYIYCLCGYSFTLETLVKNTKKRLRKANAKIIFCPICRKQNSINIYDTYELTIFGLEEKCKICEDENIEIRFPTCKHACCCKKCFAKLVR